jgi:hypothetical protein
MTRRSNSTNSPPYRGKPLTTLADIKRMFWLEIIEESPSRFVGRTLGATLTFESYVGEWYEHVKTEET